MDRKKVIAALLPVGLLLACGGGSGSSSSGSITGTWLLNGISSDTCETLTALSDGTAVYGLYRPAKNGEGLQRLTYTWNNNTFTVTGVQTDTTGDWNGFVAGTSAPFTLTGANQASVTSSNQSVTRLTASTSNPLQGTWIDGTPSSGNYGAIIFFANNFYLLFHETSSTGTGIEYGTYSWNSSTGALSVSNDIFLSIADFAFSSASTLNFMVSGATGTLVVNGSSPATFQRLERAP